jgi:hypothetical protein
MSIPDDADPDVLISRLAGPLAPADRPAFRRAAENALGQLPCMGEGAAYRTISAIWRGYFHPPTYTGWDIEHELESMRRSKLANLPPVGADDPRTGARDRKRLRLVG